jgi:hypothetical protein
MTYLIIWLAIQLPLGIALGKCIKFGMGEAHEPR